jgi:hypothetical protein
MSRISIRKRLHQLHVGCRDRRGVIHSQCRTQMSFRLLLIRRRESQPLAINSGGWRGENQRFSHGTCEFSWTDCHSELGLFCAYAVPIGSLNHWQTE